MSTRRIGVTLRVDRDAATGEMRDGLARSWTQFLRAAAPEIYWVPVPNLGTEAVAYATELNLDGLVLTGGADPGVDPARDGTEIALLHFMLKAGRPVFGVCRGMQLLVTELGGDVRPGACGDAHVAVRHRVFMEGDAAGREVNSYHRNGVHMRGVRAPMSVLAWTLDGWVEAVRAAEAPWTGVMWHPEREPVCDPRDRRLFRETFGLEMER